MRLYFLPTDWNRDLRLFKTMSFNIFTWFLTLPLALCYIDRLAYAVLKCNCKTDDCHEIAKRIKQSMNTNIDPCTDFYEYACGSWITQNPLPEDELRWSFDDILMHSTLEKLHNIVNEPHKSTDIAPVTKLKNFYQSCMNTERLEKEGIASLIGIINSAGGWPMAMAKSTWDSSKHWQQVDMTYSNIDGANAFFSVLYTHDDIDLKRNVLLLDEEATYPFLKTNEDTQADADTTIMALTEVIAKTVKAVTDYMKIKVNKKQFGQDVADLLIFEFQLHDITNQDQKGEKKNIEKTTIGGLQEWYDSLPHENSTSKIDWLELLEFSFRLANKTFTPDEPIFVTSKESLKKLSALLDKTSQRTIVNYIQWVFISRYIGYTTKELKSAKYEVYWEVYNKTILVPRWKDCINQIGMRDVISYVFVKEYFAESAKPKAEKMVDRIKKQIALGIQRTHWTSSTMKTHMIEKLYAVEKQIGYPDWYKNETYIVTIYDKLEIGDDFFQNLLTYGKFIILARVLKFYEPIDKNTWLEYPTTVNAFYSERDNIMIVPAAELQAPYFTPEIPDAINYGGIGFIIGHELSHGFDHVGINYDKHGNRVTTKVQAFLDIYKEKAKCFVDQFNAFTLNDTDENGNMISLNGDLTENENIADSTGIKVAYLAYKQEKAKCSKLTCLPGLEHLSDDKLFFLAFATSWCGVVYPILEKALINNDVHSLPKFRINGSLMNMHSFASAFNCKANSTMNPENKCTIWS